MKKIYKELTRNFSSGIPKKYYERYDVKRGLRNSDGSGVLVGLTEIGNVHGYIIDDGDLLPQDGELWYRGYKVKDLAAGFQQEKRFGFEETAYLLIFGHLPSSEQLNQFCGLIKENMDLPNRFTEDMIMTSPSNNIMNKLSRSVLALYSFDKNADDTSLENVLLQSIQLIARFPVLIAYAYQALQHYHKQKTLHIRRPLKKYSLAENFLHLTRENARFTRLEAEVLDLALVIHAEHGGGNNSSFAVHVVSSSGTDTYSAIAAAIGSLKGPKHGGANYRVISMMDDIKKNVRDWKSDSEIAAYITKIVHKKAHDHTGLVYGIGHPVYTLSDPRTVLLKGKAAELAQTFGPGREREFDLYCRIEKLAPGILRKAKNAKRPMCANVDFYSGFVYDMLDLPKDLYTAIFAMSRIVGWTAHRIEEIVSGGRIIRPAYKNIMKSKNYTQLDNRKTSKISPSRSRLEV